MADLIAELEGVSRLREASKEAGGKFSIEGTPEFVDYTRKLLALYRDHHAEIAAAVRDAETLRRAREQLPSKVETDSLGDYGPDELAAFDAGYNMALDRAHNLMSRQPGAIAAMRAGEGEG